MSYCERTVKITEFMHLRPYMELITTMRGYGIKHRGLHISVTELSSGATCTHKDSLLEFIVSQDGHFRQGNNVKIALSGPCDGQTLRTYLTSIVNILTKP
ncbi:MAG TPA: hypothetical protein VK158_06665 [Acidobacteriota bacterium]|nr:hypothetical protein [Acidobacteriota bacterium]